MELNVLSIQIDTLVRHYIHTFVPRLEQKPPTIDSIYSAFPELPEAGLRTRVKYFHDMSLTLPWPEVVLRWQEAHKAKKPGWIGVTTWGAVVALIPLIDEVHLALSKFLSTATLSCFEDPKGEWGSAVVHMATLYAGWPKHPSGDEEMRDDIAAIYYRVVSSSKDAAELTSALKSIPTNSPLTLKLEWAVRQGLTTALGEAQHLPGFSAVKATGNRLSATVDANNFVRNKVHGTVAFPFSIPRSAYDPVPEPRYPNYLHDQWASCRSFKRAGHPDGAELLAGWDAELGGRLALLISSVPSRNPLHWLMLLAQQLPNGNWRNMVTSIQTDLRELINKALLLLGETKASSRPPYYFDGVLGTTGFDSSLKDVEASMKQSQMSEEDWSRAISLTKDDMIFIGDVPYRVDGVVNSDSGTLFLKLIQG